MSEDALEALIVRARAWRVHGDPREGNGILADLAAYLPVAPPELPAARADLVARAKAALPQYLDFPDIAASELLRIVRALAAYEPLPTHEMPKTLRTRIASFVAAHPLHDDARPSMEIVHAVHAWLQATYTVRDTLTVEEACAAVTNAAPATVFGVPVPPLRHLGDALLAIRKAVR